ncbi:MAG: dynamin family protein, partial [Planctomycetota bacterium]
MKELLEHIADSVQKIYREAVDPVGKKFAFEQRPSEGEIAGPPTVLLLGNHSSGKSTFINHLLGADVQKTGLAPTDDAFTILAHGSGEEEREGKAVVSNPDLPYASLRHFGPQFLSHFQMKKRPVDLLREVTLVDSPGMIDAAKEESGRGYDFAGAIRWFAERADMVLVFFDPDKPGTTGETLQVFTESLRGIDHKLRIVMNKMDQFRSLPDFARAYGALCWN